MFPYKVNYNIRQTAFAYSYYYRIKKIQEENCHISPFEKNY